MSDLANMSLKDLLVLAKEMNIPSRHQMIKADLIVCVQKRHLEQLGENLVHVYTKPYSQRRYGAGTKNTEVYSTLPKQAKRIFDFMLETGFCGTGHAIVNAAVEKGFVETTQRGDVLYAFYARKLETAGVRLVN